jgi:hypothetical protein
VTWDRKVRTATKVRALPMMSNSILININDLESIGCEYKKIRPVHVGYLGSIKYSIDIMQCFFGSPLNWDFRFAPTGSFGLEP